MPKKTIPATDLKPGVTAMLAGRVTPVTSVRIAQWSTHIADDDGYRVEINADPARRYKLHQQIEIVPPAPAITTRWDTEESHYVIQIVSEGDVRLILNGEDVYGDAIRVPSARDDAPRELP